MINGNSNMNEKGMDPNSLTLILAILMALLGGIVKYLQESIKTGQWRKSLKEKLIDLVVSGFVGLLVGLGLTGLGVSQFITWAVAGYCGHEGARTFALAHNYLKAKGLIK